MSEDKNECSCDKKKMKAFMDALGPWNPFEDGIFDFRKYRIYNPATRTWVMTRFKDSFGFRARIDGECDVCWKAYCNSYHGPD